MSDPLAVYAEKLEQGMRAVAQHEREAQDAANVARDARLRQEGALIALRELMQLTDAQDAQGGEDGALH